VRITSPPVANSTHALTILAMTRSPSKPCVACTGGRTPRQCMSPTPAQAFGPRRAGRRAGGQADRQAGRQAGRQVGKRSSCAQSSRAHEHVK
jgi:hypothetical protein